MSVPIIFYHTGNDHYLKYSLKQARYYHPDSVIYLIGDDDNDCYSFVKHVKITDFNIPALNFAGIYKHRSTNTLWYELMCFQRWFCIREVCKAYDIEAFIYLDSDVLVFSDLNEIIPLFGPVQIANAGLYGDSPAFTYFSSFQAIDAFCSYINQSFTDPAHIRKLDEWYADYLTTQAYGGICDMTIFHHYFRENPQLFKLINLIDDKLAVDLNINNSDGFETLNGLKNICWINNAPYVKRLKTGKLIRFICLHYQGHSKLIMYKHYQAGGYLLARFNARLKFPLKRAKRLVGKALAKLKS